MSRKSGQKKYQGQDRDDDGDGGRDDDGGSSSGSSVGSSGGCGSGGSGGNSGCNSGPAAPPPSTPAGVLVGTVTDGNGLTINVYAEQVGNDVKFTVSVVSGVADLRGFFLDVAGSGAGHGASGSQVTKVKTGDNCITDLGYGVNMNGTGEAFDVGVALGTSGIGKDDIRSSTITVTGISLNELQDLSFGIRATSVGACRQDSVKLVGEFDVGATHCNNNFPMLQDDIATVTFLFDVDPSPNVVNLYAVEVNEWLAEASDDLDDNFDALLAYVLRTDPFFHSQPVTAGQLVGVAIGSVEQVPVFYALDCDTDPDPVPGGVALDTIRPAWIVEYQDALG